MHITASIITPHTITVVVDGKPRIIDSSRACFKELPDLLNRRKLARGVITPVHEAPMARVASAFRSVSPLVVWTQADEDLLVGYLDMRKYLVRITHGAVSICDDLVLFDGKPIGGVLVERLIEIQKKNYDTEPLSLFLSNLMANPIQSARDELYLWLEKSNLPITDDGYFLAWKAVRQDYKSHYDGRTDNSIGSKPFVPRDQCDTDRTRTCSSGLHFCSYDYLERCYGSNSRILVCKINPADVVSIPNDYNNTKGRAWTYEIISEVPFDNVPDFFKTPVVSAEVNDIEHLDPEEWDSDDDEAIDAYYDSEGTEITEERDGVHTRVSTYTVEVLDQNNNLLAHADNLNAAQVASIEEAYNAQSPPDMPVPPLDLNKKTLRSLLKKYSQRRIAKDTGIPRTTLQELIYRFWPEKDKRLKKKD